MSNILQFKSRNSNVMNTDALPIEENTLSIQDIEFLEDMISNSPLATIDEVEFECEDGFCITFKGDVKVSPKLTDYYNYLQNRNEQRRVKSIIERRVKNLKLV
jgi:hypothetical protein